MYQVQEFKGEKSTYQCNKWLKEMDDTIELVSFKYSTAFKPETTFSTPVCLSSILVIFKIKKENK